MIKSDRIWVQLVVPRRRRTAGMCSWCVKVLTHLDQGDHWFGTDGLEQMWVDLPCELDTSRVLAVVLVKIIGREVSVVDFAKDCEGQKNWHAQRSSGNSISFQLTVGLCTWNVSEFHNSVLASYSCYFSESMFFKGIDKDLREALRKAEREAEGRKASRKKRTIEQKSR